MRQAFRMQRCFVLDGRGTAIALAAAAALLCAHPTHAQDMDMDTMMRWASVQRVKYRIVGAFDAQTSVTANSQGLGEVKDRVVINLVWDQTTAQLVGTPTFENSPTTVGKLSDREPKCVPPVLSGTYEHFDLMKVTPGIGATIVLEAKRSFPDAKTSKVCSSLEASPRKTGDAREELVIPATTILGMPVASGAEAIVRSADRKSMTWKRQGWTWTFTPSP